jgi:hypothetical protein
MKLEITLTEAQAKAANWMAADPQAWFANMVDYRCRVAMQEIYDQEVARLKVDPTTTHIPINIEEVVLAADIKSAAQRNLEIPNPTMPTP